MECLFPIQLDQAMQSGMVLYNSRVTKGTANCAQITIYRRNLHEPSRDEILNHSGYSCNALCSWLIIGCD